MIFVIRKKNSNRSNVPVDDERNQKKLVDKTGPAVGLGLSLWLCVLAMASCPHESFKTSQPLFGQQRR